MRDMSCYLPVRQLYKGATFPTFPAGRQREILDAGYSGSESPDL